MNRQQIKEIVLDQIEIYLNQDYVKREYILDKEINYCFVGIRRCGKSFLMYQLAHEIIESGIDRDRVVYVNFEDERLLEFSYRDFDTLLEIALELSSDKGLPYLFLDEIQNIEGWEKFARRLADMKYHVSITGSNSRMLSKEIASTLGGRFMIIDVFPYSFSEYLKANGIAGTRIGTSTKSRAEISKLFNQYLTYGAFPELVRISNKRDYLNSIYQTIYLGDIIARNKLDNSFALRLILKKLAESVMRPISFSRLYNITKSSGAEVGKQTVINYIGHALDALLLFSIPNYAAKLVDKETSPKYYFMDSGLLGLFGLKDPFSAQLENLAAIELVRRFGKENVYYFERNIEVDFYIPDKNLAIQVCYDLFDDDTYRRETEALVKLKSYEKDAECIILTMSDGRRIEENGIPIDVVPMWKWLPEK